MVIVGIDPGSQGAVAFLDEAGELTVFDAPTIMTKRGKTVKSEYDPAGMARVLDPARQCGGQVFIEAVHSMQGQGLSSTFHFGKGFGMWIGILAALKLPYTLVTPQRWKKDMMEGTGKDKGASRQRAMQLFPAHRDFFFRVKDDGRAEAALMAMYGAKQTPQFKPDYIKAAELADETL